MCVLYLADHIGSFTIDSRWQLSKHLKARQPLRTTLCEVQGGCNEEVPEGTPIPYNYGFPYFITTYVGCDHA